MSTDTVTPEAALGAYVAAEIRAQLGRLDISRAELARRLATDQTWIGKRLNGRVEITLSDLERIARALRIEPGKLLPRVTLPELRPTPARSLNRPPNRPAARHRSTGPARTSPIRQLIPA